MVEVRSHPRGDPMRFFIEESDEIITTHCGLALIGLLLDKTYIAKRINALTVPGRSYTEISNTKLATVQCSLHHSSLYGRMNTHGDRKLEKSFEDTLYR